MKKILVVDDSFAWREFHKNNLEELFIELDITDYKIDIADSGEKGYNFALNNANEPYNIIITDLQMEENFSPKFAGEWLVEQIKNLNNYYNTKIIICSGCKQIKTIAESFSTDYIPKWAAVSDINQYKKLISKLLFV